MRTQCGLGGRPADGPKGEEVADLAVGSTGSPRLWRLVVTVLLPFAMGYFLSYLYRSVNAVLAPNLVADLGVGPAVLGLLTSTYFLGFAVMQLPIGVALDRFGPRRVQAAFLVVAACGAAIFGSSESLVGLIVGRFVIGAGVAVALMGSFKAVVLWFPRRRWAFFNGCVMGVGGLGAVFATAPVELALRVTTWRGIFYLLAVLTVIVAAAIMAVVPEKPTSSAGGSLREQCRGLGVIVRDRLFWRVAPLAAVIDGAAMAIQGLWAGPWLRDVAAQSRAGVAGRLLLAAAMLAVGKLGVGLLADFLNNRYAIGMLRLVSIGAGLFLALQVLLIARVDPAGYWIWILFGPLSAVSTLAFPVLSQHFPTTYSARSNTGLNLLMFGFSFVAQYAIGVVIGLWTTSANGHYLPVAYSAAFGMVLGVEALALLWFLLWRQPEGAPAQQSERAVPTQENVTY